jgi:hypothetical protein
MRDVCSLVLSVALPWAAGALWLRLLSPQADRQVWLLAAGYGYLAGAFVLTLVLRALDLFGVRWTLLAAALPMGALTLLGGVLLYRTAPNKRDGRSLARAVLAGLAAA